MTDESTNVRRRNVLKTIGAGAISTTSLVRAASAENKTEIVIARGGPDDEPRHTEEVPTKWFDHSQAIETARDRLVHQLKAREFVNGFSLTNSVEKIEDIHYSQIELTVDTGTSDEELAALPSTLEQAGVNVPAGVVVTDITIRRESKQLTAAVCTDNQKNDEPFPAGYLTKAFFDGGDTEAISTAGYRVYDDDVDEERMLTANHILRKGGLDNCGLSEGKDLYDYANPANLVGTGTSKGNYGTDWILLDPAVSLSDEDGADAYAYLYENFNGKQKVDGWVTKDGADYLMGAEEIVENYGSLTGWSTGYIENLDETASGGCVNLFLEGVKVSCVTGAGDSGGPVWWDDSGSGRFIIGHNSLFPSNTTKQCSPIGEAKYGEYGVFYPFFRIHDNNFELKLGPSFF